MPRITAADAILEYTVVAANALQGVATTIHIPVVGGMCGLALEIIPLVQNSKFQKERCLRIVENMYHLLSILLELSKDSENIHSAKMLKRTAQFTLILQKLHSCLKVQRELGSIKRLFKQSELVTQLNVCEAEFKTALRSFMTEQNVETASALSQLNQNTRKRHREVLELVNNVSFDAISSITSRQYSLNSSSGSFSLLPASPKIFHGRDAELEGLVNTLLAPPAYVSILGPGGIGKTTLAVAALHDPKVVDKYPMCHFIPCESTPTHESLVANVASHFGLETHDSSGRHIVHYLKMRGTPSLMILDNFETPWEPVESRQTAEEFLSLLTDVPCVSLLITMRGAERPAKVKWTHPFLRPLTPLSPIAARQTFIEIADEMQNNEDVDQLLEITDNIPLAIQLIATVAASEGGQATLDLWKVERTAVLSDGHDKQSNLEVSIVLSLSSPRMQAFPQAVDLLSLMSLLPDGISDIDLIQSKPPIPDILRCKTTLIRTSLAYIDHAGRLKVLAPIREYVRALRPPSPVLVRSVRKHLNDLLDLWNTLALCPALVGGLMPRLSSNLGNLHSVLSHGLEYDYADLEETIMGVTLLNSLNVNMNRGPTTLMLLATEKLAETNNHEVHGELIRQVLYVRKLYHIMDPVQYIDKAIEHFRVANNPDKEASVYIVAAHYYFQELGDRTKAEGFFSRAILLGSGGATGEGQIYGLLGLARMQCYSGNYSEGLRLTHEARKIAVASRNVFGEMQSIRWQAICHLSLGDFKQCLRLVNIGRELVAQVGLQGGDTDTMLMNIEANVYQTKTEYTKSRRVHEAILGLIPTILPAVGHAYVLINIASLDILTGGSTKIVSHSLDLAISNFQSVNNQHGVSACELLRADLQLRDGDKAGAYNEYIRLFSRLWTTDNELSCLCLIKLADPAHSVLPATPATQQWAMVFLSFAMRPAARNMLTVHQALRCLGDVFAQQGTDNSALTILVVALEGLTWMDIHQRRAECMRTIGDLYLRRGDVCNARAMWSEALPLFKLSEQQEAAAGIAVRLAGLGTEM